MDTSHAIPPEWLLHRHRARREQHIPTLSLLLGPVPLGIQVWRAWNQKHSMPILLLPVTSDEAVSKWVCWMERQPWFPKTALDWLAERVGEALGNLAGRLAAMTPHDRDRFWHAHALDTHGDTASLCRSILATGSHSAPLGLRNTLLKHVFPNDSNHLRLIRALWPLMPKGQAPSFFLHPLADEDPAEWLAQAVELASRWVLAVPSLTLAIAVSRKDLDAFLMRPLHAHVLALLREGEVFLPPLEAPALRAALEGSGVDPTRWETSIQTLAARGADPGLIARFVEAARCLEQQASGEEEDRARSAAERFLFEQLNALPETMDLFALNEPLEFRHGPVAAEVDLVARELKLVIEVDGSYYHLKDQAAYRRDRRKDWQLQRHGYVVLRFLAEDIVQRLEEILTTILDAVAFRRSTHARGSPP